ncbi:MAG: diaminopimelate decarboxylase [Planctomycetota bacterium]
MEQFSYKGGNLFCDRVPVGRIADKVGTPTYIYSREALVSRFRDLKTAFAPVRPLICYSIKACSNQNIIKLMAGEGSGFDVVSGGELYRALQAGAKADRIVFAGVGKTDEEIRDAIRAGILMFNVESEAELERISDIAQRMKKPAGIAFRINPDVDPKTHRYMATGKKETKFGIDLARAGRVVDSLPDHPGVVLRGIHMHIGSQITDLKPHAKALRKIVRFVEMCKARGHKIEYINMGGGFGITYNSEPRRTAKDFARQIIPIVKKTGCRLLMEPGRFIVGNSAILLTRVVYTKKAGDGRTFVICDAAMNDLIRPTLYEAYHRIWPAESSNSRPKILADIVGPVCETGDFFAKERAIPAVEKDDLLAIFSAGAYGMAMSSNYNSRRRPCEVLVAGARFRVIRRRDTYADLIAPEKGRLPAYK